MLNEPFSSCGGLMLMNMEKWNSLSPAQQDVITKAMIQTEIDGAAMFTKTVEEVIATITADGVKEIKLSRRGARRSTFAYRDSHVGGGPGQMAGHRSASSKSGSSTPPSRGPTRCGIHGSRPRPPTWVWRTDGPMTEPAARGGLS